jgi:hypothetical protein
VNILTRKLKEKKVEKKEFFVSIIESHRRKESSGSGSGSVPKPQGSRTLVFRKGKQICNM